MLPRSIVYPIGPSSRSSSTPVTVTVCGMSQFATPKVSGAAGTVPSPASLLTRLMITSCVGATARLTSKVAVPPPSVVVRPATGSTTTPAISVWSVAVFTGVGSVTLPVAVAVLETVPAKAGATLQSSV